MPVMLTKSWEIVKVDFHGVRHLSSEEFVKFCYEIVKVKVRWLTVGLDMVVYRLVGLEIVICVKPVSAMAVNV